MNIRRQHESTVEGRFAAICRIAMFRIVNTHHHLPDYADFREALRIPLQIEILAARLEEARLKPDNDDRVHELIEQLAALQKEDTG